MGLFDSKHKVKINDENINFAKQVASRIKDEKTRKRVFVSFIGLGVLFDELKKQKLNPDIYDTLHTTESILNNFEIADLNINGLRADVRVIIGDEYPQMWIPRNHYKNGLAPDVYVGVLLDTKFKKAEIVGYIEASKVSSNVGNKNYLFVDSDNLKPFSHFKKLLKSSTPKFVSIPESHHARVESMLLDFIDGQLSLLDREFVLKHLATCHRCRQTLQLVAGYERVLYQVKHYPDFTKDYTLDMFTGTLPHKPEEVIVNLKDHNDDDLEEVNPPKYVETRDEYIYDTQDLLLEEQGNIDENTNVDEDITLNLDEIPDFSDSETSNSEANFELDQLSDAENFDQEDDLSQLIANVDEFSENEEHVEENALPVENKEENEEEDLLSLSDLENLLSSEENEENEKEISKNTGNEDINLSESSEIDEENLLKEIVLDNRPENLENIEPLILEEETPLVEEPVLEQDSILEEDFSGNLEFLNDEEPEELVDQSNLEEIILDNEETLPEITSTNENLTENESDKHEQDIMPELSENNEESENISLEESLEELTENLENESSVQEGIKIEDDLSAITSAEVLDLLWQDDDDNSQNTFEEEIDLEKLTQVQEEIINNEAAIGTENTAINEESINIEETDTITPEKHPSGNKNKLIIASAVAVIGIMAGTGYMIMHKSQPEVPQTAQTFTDNSAALPNEGMENNAALPESNQNPATPQLQL